MNTVTELPSIKERLLERFRTAKGIVPEGQNWIDLAVKADSFLDSREGGKYIQSMQAANSDPVRRGNREKMERVVLALEKALGIEGSPIV